MTQLLPGATAVVTGAARGIGLAIARRCGEHGATVVLLDRDAEALAKSANELVATGIAAEALTAEALQEKLDQIPLARAGEPSEVADAVVFLSSPMSSYVTGAVLEVTGGRHM
jgi:NAD(P)-dependent dehydrogenase (short-subunit alcohol dehydrogenase family)